MENLLLGFSKTKADNLQSGLSAVEANVTEVRCVMRQKTILDFLLTSPSDLINM